MRQGGDSAQGRDKTFQGSGIMLFRIRELKAWLLDGPTAFTQQPRNVHHKFHFSMADRKRFEGSANLTELDDMAGFAIGTLDMIGVN